VIDRLFTLAAPQMAGWQGPALLCFNNAVFSPADFHNISRIGQDSKIDKPAATGVSSLTSAARPDLYEPFPGCIMMPIPG
jgi:hypothetical protein